MDPVQSAYALDWLHLVVRWLHIAAAIAWVGASFYFIALDQSLRDAEDERDTARGVDGEAWEIHGGGFYRIEKFRVAPARLPGSLRWFRWEAYITWLSGFGLLVLLYYVDPARFLIDQQVMALEPWAAVAASVAILGVGWLAYDLASRVLEDRPLVLAVAVIALVVAVVWVSTQLFSARAAYIQAGSALGTWMAANVLFTIIPGQRELVAATQAGREPDARYGLRGKQRSVHNNYLTLPVIFAMISQHFPFTYGHPFGAALLLALMAAGATVQHFLNVRHQGRTEWPLLWGAAGIVLVVALVAAPATVSAEPLTPDEVTAVREVFTARCVSCHAERPTNVAFTAPPKGLSLEGSARIRATAQLIYQQVVVSRAMPLGNQTGMTEEERALIARWYRTGAPLP
ncbi:MAG: urate hydroxylase PuuD [Candidatus Limnocylindria bacterium]